MIVTKICFNINKDIAIIIILLNYHLSNQRITAFGMNRMFGCQVTNFEQFVRELDT